MKNPEENPEVSVIIPAYNTEKYVEECLLSLTKQTFKNFEIIVVDDASGDRTSHIAQKYARVIRNKTHSGEGISRNIGADAAHGEILAHTDADAILPPTWLERIVTNLKQKGIKAVAGGYCGSTGDSFIERFSHLELVFRRRDFDGYVNTAVSNNFACYRDVFFKFGGFAEKIKGEDLILSFKISEHYPIYWDKENGILHHFRPSLKTYLKQQYYFGRDTVMVYYYCPRMILKRTHQGKQVYLETILMFLTIAALFMYPIVVPVLLILILLLNFNFLSFLKKENLPVMRSALIIVIRDVVCVFSVFSGAMLVLKEFVKRGR